MCFQLKSKSFIIQLRGVKFFSVKSTLNGWWYVKMWLLKPPAPGYIQYLKKPDVVHNAKDGIVVPRQWHHLCVSVNGLSKQVEKVLVRINRKCSPIAITWT